LLLHECFIYDEKISQNLHDNPRSAINLSIDAGTPETWKKVKGVDNFDLVTENLVKYFSNSARPGQITLKYIVLPGINDNYEDYQSAMEIMKIFKTGHLTIARDTRIKYSAESPDQGQLITSAAYLLAFCSKYGYSADMFTYSPEERSQVAVVAKEILAKNMI
jgi:wyosine [tRNA(Phe)-imidazoG37] synthetase (radical SAM superfamily)